MFKDLNVDSMKAFASKLDLPRILTRKPELIAALDKELRSNLPASWLDCPRPNVRPWPRRFTTAA